MMHRFSIELGRRNRSRFQLRILILRDSRVERYNRCLTWLTWQKSLTSRKRSETVPMYRYNKTEKVAGACRSQRLLGSEREQFAIYCIASKPRRLPVLGTVLPSLVPA